MGIAATDLAIVKTADKASVSPGDVLTHTLSISNLGPAPAEQIEGQTEILVADDTPDELEDVRYSMDGGATWDAWGGAVALSSMEVGQTVVVLIQGRVGIFAEGVISNTATVSFLFLGYVNLDINLSNNTSTVDVSVVKPITRDDVINQIISSIAMEELALSHIINAEGEKIQYILNAVSSPTASVDDVLKVNSSVNQTLSAILQNQMLLNRKFKEALRAHE